MALRPGPGGAGSFVYPVGGGLGPPQGMMQPAQQQGFPMVQVMQPNMMGINFGTQMPPGAVPMQGAVPLGMQATGMPFMAQPQFISMRAPGPPYSTDMHKHLAEEHQKRLEQQQRMLEEERKRRQFEEQKQKLRLLSSIKPKAGEKSRDDALEAIKGNLDGFSRDAKLHPTPSPHPNKAGVGVYSQQEQIQPIMPAWLYNDSLVPELFRKVLEATLTPAGIDTAKLYPILMSSGLPREALGQIWASANRTTPGKLTKEELYTVLAMIGVTQSGIPAMGLEILSQFHSPPIPSLPALAMALPPVPPQHQQPIMSQTPVSMATPAPTTAAVGLKPNASSQPQTSFSTCTQPQTSFSACFPAPQGAKADDDDFQEFQEAPKAGAADDPFTEFPGEPDSAFPTPSRSQSSAPAMLTPVSRSSSSDKYAVFKQLSVEQASDTISPVSDFADKYSVFRELEQLGDRKSVDKGFADFRSASTDDGFTDFKTADSISPLEATDQTKLFQPTFPPPVHQQPHNSAVLPQHKNPLKMSDLDLFSSVASAPAALPKSPPFPPNPSSMGQPAEGAQPLGRPANDFGEFSLFGPPAAPSGGSAGTAQDDFADFMAFGSSSDHKASTKSGKGASDGLEEAAPEQQQHGSDKYKGFSQLSQEGSLGYNDSKESSSCIPCLKSEGDDFAEFQSSKFSTALGASEKSLLDKVSAFKQAKEDSFSVKSLDLPSIGGSSAGKEDSEDTLSVQLDMKLSDVGGDLKHVMSDSSLDLPTMSAHQPPAAGEELVRLLW